MEKNNFINIAHRGNEPKLLPSYLEEDCNGIEMDVHCFKNGNIPSKQIVVSHMPYVGFPFGNPFIKSSWFNHISQEYLEKVQNSTLNTEDKYAYFEHYLDILDANDPQGLKALYVDIKMFGLREKLLYDREKYTKLLADLFQNYNSRQLILQSHDLETIAMLMKNSKLDKDNIKFGSVIMNEKQYKYSLDFNGFVKNLATFAVRSFLIDQESVNRLKDKHGENINVLGWKFPYDKGTQDVHIKRIKSLGSNLGFIKDFDMKTA